RDLPRGASRPRHPEAGVTISLLAELRGMRSHIALAAILALAASSGLLAGPRASAAPSPAHKRAHAAGSARGLDAGARAAATPVDRALAARGKELFQSKTCATCHGLRKSCSEIALSRS